MQNFNATERFFLKCSHNAPIIVFMIGFLLCQHFLSEHLLVPTLVVKFLSIAGVVLLARKQDPYKSAERRLGKAILRLAKPFNIICCGTGLIIFYYGCWLDDYYVMIGAAVLVTASSQWHLRKAKRAVSK